MSGKSVYEISLREKRKEAKDEMLSAAVAYNCLNNKKTDYARTVKAWSGLLADVYLVYKEAPDSIKELDNKEA